MRDTQTRMAQVVRRAQLLRRERERKTLGALSAASAALTGCLIVLMAQFTEPGTAAVSGMYGSVLLREGVGGYALVGVVSFASAVAITLLCLWFKNRSRKGE